MDANDEQISRSILSGIIKGNDALEQWSGEWVCERANSEFMLQYSCGSSLRERFPKQRIWPEVAAEENFRWIGTDYNKLEGDGPLVSVFGLCRYDLGVLDSPGVCSRQNQLRHLIEIKKSWDCSAKRNDPRRQKSDLTKLARALYHLRYGRDPKQGGVQLQSVFFGAFLFHKPNAKERDRGLRPYKWEEMIKSDLEGWWNTVTAYPGKPKLISKSHILKPEPEFLWVQKPDRCAGAVSVCLSIDRSAQTPVV